MGSWFQASWRSRALAMADQQRMQVFQRFLQSRPHHPIPLSHAQLAHCKCALKELSNKLSASAGRSKIDQEFNSLSCNGAHLKEILAKTTVARMDKNLAKNRYVNVLPFDESRVTLNSSDLTSSYINASYIVDPRHGNLPKVIATQGPLKNTVSDFWEMVMQQRCPVIVMLTCLVDRHSKMEKCHNYFPEKLQESQVHGRIKITNKGMKISENSVAVRSLEVEYTQSQDPPLPVLHLQYLDWPDQGVPISTVAVRELFEKLYCIPSTFGPFVVHCSTGIGRTGTFCTIDQTLRRILLGDMTAVDIEETVRQLRQQRFGLVESREQYGFCYRTVLDELQQLSLQGA